MKTIRVLTTGLFLLLAVQFSFGQTTEFSVVNYEVNVTCGHCKTTIETALNDVEGIKYSNVNLTSKIVNVKYNDDIISKQEVEKIIQDAGDGYTTKLVVAKKNNHKSGGHNCKTPCRSKCND